MTPDRDIELNRLDRVRSLAEGSSVTVHGGPISRHASVSDTGRPGTGPGPGSHSSSMKAGVNRFLDSFRREDSPPVHTFGLDAYTDEPVSAITASTSGGIPPNMRSYRGGGGDERYYDLRSASTKTASTLLARELKGRHLQMIAISGSIGTGLFVASGKALSDGGPASMLLAYLIVGVMLYCTVQALGELAVVFPVAGSFSAFSSRFLDPCWGFAMGWMYVALFFQVLWCGVCTRRGQVDLGTNLWIAVMRSSGSWYYPSRSWLAP
jgi:amino acid transporter